MTPEEHPASLKPAAQGGGSTLSSFGKGLVVFECVADALRPVGVLEIASRTGIEKSAVQRIVNTLVQAGYFLRDARTRKYRVGPKALRLGYGYLATDTLVRTTMPHLFRLSDIVQSPVTLAVKLGQELIVAARLRLNAVHNSSSVLGERLPFCRSASGRAILAHLPRDEALEIMRSPRSGNFPPGPVPDPEAMYRELLAARPQGFVVTEDDITKCKVKFAAPIFDRDQYPVAALVVCILSPEIDRIALEQKIGPLLLSATTEITKAIRVEG